MCLFEKLICKKKNNKKKKLIFKIDPNFFLGQNAIIIIVKNKK